MLTPNFLAVCLRHLRSHCGLIHIITTHSLGVLATSLKKETALEFIERADDTKPKILWCIRVDGRGQKDPRYRCKHASYVYKSLVPGEGEFLFAVSFLLLFVLEHCV